MWYGSGRKLPILPLICWLLEVLEVRSVDEPNFVGTVPSLTVAAGRDAVLKCVVDRLNTYRVAWIYVEKQTLLTIDTYVITKNSRIGVSHKDKRQWFLHIKNVMLEDSGYYMCQINTQPMISQVGHLNVVEPPRFVDDSVARNISKTENSNVSMSCRATGNPTPKIIWSREDGQIFSVGKIEEKIYEGEELHLLGVSRVHMGVYLCKATNGVPPATTRRIYLNVDFPPMIWIPNQVVGALPGANTSLECHTEAHPHSANQWLHHGAPIPSNLSKYEIMEWRNQYKVHMKLRIANVSPPDYGQYKCIARNAISETAGTVELYRLYLQSANTDQPADATVGMADLSHHKNSDKTRDRMLLHTEELEDNRYSHSENTRRVHTFPGISRGSHRSSSACSSLRSLPLVVLLVIIC